MQAIKPFTEILTGSADLTTEQAGTVADLLIRPDVSMAEKQAFLLALANKGETAVEVAAFARVFRDRAIDPGVEEWAGRAIDVCGTGGDGSGTFNISTATALVVAGAGLKVAKYGNWAISRRCARSQPGVAWSRSSAQEGTGIGTSDRSWEPPPPWQTWR